jgi:4-hydroxymandelate oxidase
VNGDALDTLRDEAGRLLQPAVAEWLAAGAGRGDSVAANEQAWRAAVLRPRALRDVAVADTASSFLGQPTTMPIAVAPVGHQRLMNSGGERATTAGSAAAGSLCVLPTRCSVPLGEAVSGLRWFQVYVMADRAWTEAVVRAAVAAGVRALVLTADTPVIGPKHIPAFDPVGDVFMANARPGLAGRTPSEIRHAADHNPSATFDDIGWLAGISGLPVVVKGILRSDDALACVAHGASGVLVSNHGGRQLDGALPSAVALPEIVAAIGDRAEVYVDGGIRAGADVLRALALGAHGVFIGRPAMWGLAARGAHGVQTVLQTLAGQLRVAMMLAGVTTCRELAAAGLTG